MKKKSRGTADSFLFGKARLECAEDELIPMLNVLLSMGESYSNIVSGDGVASVDIAYISARRAVALCRASGIEVKAVLLSGLPYYFGRLLLRHGLIAGMIVGLLILILGNSVLWDIRVAENEAVETAEVKALLAEYGVKPGAWLSRIDVGDIQTRIEHDSDEIAWISINVIGTVAYVEVIPEVNATPEDVGEGDGANLVAARDGVIIAREEGRGVAPIMALLDARKLRRAIVFDKVIGKAAAAVCVAGGARKVVALVMSNDAAELLNANGIEFMADKTVDCILNRTQKGRCPMENAVSEINEPNKIVERLRKAMKK